MTDLPNSPKIAIYNPDLDNSSMMQAVIENSGYPSIAFAYNPTEPTHFNRVDYLKNLVNKNRPQILFLHVWNETSWNLFINLRESVEAEDCKIILTTTLGGTLEDFTKNLLEPVKVISFPCEIDEIIKCVRQELTPAMRIEGRSRFKEGEII